MASLNGCLKDDDFGRAHSRGRNNHSHISNVPVGKAELFGNITQSSYPPPNSSFGMVSFNYRVFNEGAAEISQYDITFYITLSDGTYITYNDIGYGVDAGQYSTSHLDIDTQGKKETGVYIQSLMLQ